MASNGSNRMRLRGLAIGAVLLVPATAAPADFTWNGNGAGNLWTEGANWVGGVAPPSDFMGMALIYGPVGGEDQFPTLPGSFNAVNVGSISFTGADASYFQIGDGNIDMSVDAEIVNDSMIEQTLASDVIFGRGDTLTINAQDGDLLILSRLNIADTDGVDLIVTGVNDVNLAARIVGSQGRIVKMGTGTLTLGGDSNFGGGVELTAGTLVVNRNSALGSGTIEVTGDAEMQAGIPGLNLLRPATIDAGITLTVGGENNLLWQAVIDGDGMLRVNTDSPDVFVSLAGANTYTGGTILAGGSIFISNDAALGTGDVTLTGDGQIEAVFGRTIENNFNLGANTLTFSGLNSMTLEGVIDGAGGLTIDVNPGGTGSLILEADHTYTGPTSVLDGGLRVNGSIMSDVTVGATGVLTGEGTITGNVVAEAGGVVEGGNLGIGTLTIDGGYDVEADGITRVQVDVSDLSNDLIDVSGAATFAADAVVETSVIGNGYLPSNQLFTVLEADGGITDAGALITTNLDLTTISLIRDSGFMDGDTSFAIQVLRAADAYAAAASGANNVAIGSALDSAFIPLADADATGSEAQILGALDVLEPADYNAAIRQLSPESYNAVAGVGVQGAQLFAIEQAAYLAGRRGGYDAWTDMLQRTGPQPGAMASASSDPSVLMAALAQADELGVDQIPRQKDEPWAGYAKFQGVFSNQDTTSSRTGYDASSIGGQAGIDYAFSPDLFAGIAIGGSYADVDLDGGLGEIDDHAIRVGPYMSFRDGDWYVDVSVTFGLHNYDSEREIPFAGLRADADYDATEITGYVGTGYHFLLSRDLILTPTLSAQYSWFDYDGFTEKGAGAANLTVEDRDDDSLLTRLGLLLTYQVDAGSVFVPYVYGGWEHQWLDDDDIDAVFVVGGGPFTIDTGNPNEDSFYIGAGLSALIDYNFAVFARIERATADDGDVTSVAGGISLTF